VRRAIVACDQCAKEINGPGVILVDVAAVRLDVTAIVRPTEPLALLDNAVAPARGEVCSPGCLGAWLHDRLKPLETRPEPPPA
jgi:hypothetical protein